MGGNWVLLFYFIVCPFMMLSFCFKNRIFWFKRKNVSFQYYFETCEMNHVQGNSSSTVCSHERWEAPKVNTSGDRGFRAVEFCSEQSKEPDSLKCSDMLKGIQSENSKVWTALDTSVCEEGVEQISGRVNGTAAAEAAWGQGWGGAAFSLCPFVPLRFCITWIWLLFKNR